MIADKSTTNLNFFYFFTGLGEAGLAARSEQLFYQLFNASRWAGCLVELGHWLRKRTIVTEPDNCRCCWTPTARTIIRFMQHRPGMPDPTPNNYSFYFWAAGPGKRNRTIIRSGQQVEPGWAGTRKANNGCFLRVWW